MKGSLASIGMEVGEESQARTSSDWRSGDAAPFTRSEMRPLTCRFETKRRREGPSRAEGFLVEKFARAQASPYRVRRPRASRVSGQRKRKKSRRRWRRRAETKK